MSILKSVLHRGAGTVTLVYANRDEQSVIFRDELVSLAGAFPDRFVAIHWLESVQGLPSRAALRQLAAPHADRTAYICGPEPFMDAVTASLAEAGMPHDRVHVERFLSLANDPFTDVPVVLDESGPAGTVEVELDGQRTTLAWPAGNHLLDVMLQAGLDAPFSCREGQCSACTCRLVEGEVSLDHNEVLEKEDLAEGYILACQAVPLTDHVKISYD
jgi:3-ketosteroid 9alpha-monooxygenase subunit B